jgi:hypothetical protein
VDHPVSPCVVSGHPKAEALSFFYFIFQIFNSRPTEGQRPKLGAKQASTVLVYICLRVVSDYHYICLRVLFI